MATRIWCLIGFRVGFATVDDVEAVGSECWYSEVNMRASKGASRYLTQIGQNVKDSISHFGDGVGRSIGVCAWQLVVGFDFEELGYNRTKTYSHAEESMLIEN